MTVACLNDTISLCTTQELVEMIKAKRAAQDQVAAKSKKWTEVSTENHMCTDI